MITDSDGDNGDVLMEAVCLTIKEKNIIYVAFNHGNSSSYLFNLYSKNDDVFPFITEWMSGKFERIYVGKHSYVIPARARITYSKEIGREIWEELTDCGFVIKDMIEDLGLTRVERVRFSVLFSLQFPSKLTIV